MWLHVPKLVSLFIPNTEGELLPWSLASLDLKITIKGSFVQSERSKRLCPQPALPSVWKAVRCVFLSLTYLALCGDVTSSFITPHGQLSADGKMEVVTWGPAGGYGYH